MNTLIFKIDSNIVIVLINGERNNRMQFFKAGQLFMYASYCG